MNEFEGREARVPDNFPNGTWDLRKTETGWALIRTSPPLVPADQPPPEGMPPIRLEVLDSLADDIETIDTMRSVGNVEPYGLALVGERYILEALRSLLTDGLIEAFGITGDPKTRRLVTTPVAEPRTDDDHLRTYWFGMTPAGKAEWEKGAPLLDEYWEEHRI